MATTKPYHLLDPDERRRAVDSLREPSPGARTAQAGLARPRLVLYAPLNAPVQVAARRGQARLAVRIGLWVAATVAGYAAYRYVVLNVLPNGEVFGVVPLAILAAVATFFAPCCLPVLPGLVARLHSQMARSEDATPVRGLPLAAAGGALALLLVVGPVAAVAAPAMELGPGPWMRAFWGTVGSILVVVGLLAFLRARAEAAEATRAPLGTGRAYATAFLYGLGYMAVSVLFVAALLAGIVELGLRRSPAWAAAGLAAYAATIVLLFVAAGWAARPDPRPPLLPASARASWSVPGLFELASGVMLVFLAVFTAEFMRWFVPA